MNADCKWNQSRTIHWDNKYITNFKYLPINEFDMFPLFILTCAMCFRTRKAVLAKRKLCSCNQREKQVLFVFFFLLHNIVLTFKLNQFKFIYIIENDRPFGTFWIFWCTSNMPQVKFIKKKRKINNYHKSFSFSSFDMEKCVLCTQYWQLNADDGIEYVGWNER